MLCTACCSVLRTAPDAEAPSCPRCRLVFPADTQAQLEQRVAAVLNEAEAAALRTSPARAAPLLARIISLLSPALPNADDPDLVAIVRGVERAVATPSPTSPIARALKHSDADADAHRPRCQLAPQHALVMQACTGLLNLCRRAGDVAAAARVTAAILHVHQRHFGAAPSTEKASLWLSMASALRTVPGLEAEAATASARALAHLQVLLVPDHPLLVELQAGE